MARSMGSRKRRRDIDDVDSTVEVESASSSFRQAIPKRSRVALAHENGGSVVSDDDEDDDADSTELDALIEEGSDAANEPATFSETEEEEIDELQATQILEKQIRTRELRDNMASEQGIIEEVYCRNFMCHAKLRIHIGPLINFIVGHNGSGKSAVLTALTMCLGGKATATNRGASLKSLIKEGEESATLAVKIKNQGDGAYRPELYGRSITVERHFTRSGTSGFKLKNAQDKIISTKKSDLDDLLDFFAFQLDNPINVLTQDMARQFLSNSSPSDKYKFFIRGTQLEVLDADYKLLEEHLDGIVIKLHSRKQDIDHLKQNYKEAEEKKARIEQINTIRQRIRDVQRQHAWAQVEEQERLLEKAEQGVASAEARVIEVTDVAENIDGVYEGHNQSWEASKRTLAEFQAQVDSSKEKLDVEKEPFDANKAELLKHKTEERTIKGNINKAKSDVKKYEKAVDEERNRLAEAEGPEHAERLERLEQLKAAANDARRHQMEHGTGIAQLTQTKEDATSRWQAAKPQQTQREDDVKKFQQRLNDAKEQQPRPFDGYRPNMENLVRAINRETRWRSKPVGPIGHHVKLLKQEWSSQIEKTFGGTLDSFVVTSKEDSDLLDQIMRRVNCTPGILIGSDRPLDTTGKEPQPDVDTMLRVLVIDNDAVRNQLIINQAIEQTVLIKNRTDAQRFAWGGARPQNVRAVISHHDHDSRRGWRFEWARSGATKSSPVAKWEGLQRMRSDREEQIASYQADVDQAKRELQAVQNEVRQLRDASTKANQDVVAFKRRQTGLVAEAEAAEDAVTELQNEIENGQPQDGKLQELERQLAEAKEELETGERSYMDMVDAKDRLNQIAIELKVKVDAVQKELDEASDRVTKAEKRVEKADLARQTALREKNLAHEHIKDATLDQTKAEKDRDAQKQTVDEYVQQASTIAARVPVDRGMTAVLLDKRLEKLVSERDRAMREAGGTPEELQAAYLQAKGEYREAERQWKEMNEFAKTLRETLTYRHYRWRMFRKYISARARTNFGYLLSERQFRGRVLLNHNTHELDIKVEPDLSKTSDAGRATKTLSGGEKSFSTICLLLSIWEAMGSPIRCLDEFDVFMDSVNRAQSMSMMIAAARRSVGRQFILITPQSMNNVEMGDDVKVHKMSDPERGQTVLPFGATQA